MAASAFSLSAHLSVCSAYTLGAPSNRRVLSMFLSACHRSVSLAMGASHAMIRSAASFHPPARPSSSGPGSRHHSRSFDLTADLSFAGSISYISARSAAASSCLPSASIRSSSSADTITFAYCWSSPAPPTVVAGASRSLRQSVDGRSPMIGHELLIGGWTRDGPSRRVMGPDDALAFPERGWRRSFEMRVWTLSVVAAGSGGGRPGTNWPKIEQMRTNTAQAARAMRPTAFSDSSLSRFTLRRCVLSSCRSDSAPGESPACCCCRCVAAAAAAACGCCGIGPLRRLQPRTLISRSADSSSSSASISEQSLAVAETRRSIFLALTMSPLATSGSSRASGSPALRHRNTPPKSRPQRRPRRATAAAAASSDTTSSAQASLRRNAWSVELR
nr:unnamed protein product [Digitaria exilis]